jgi:UDP:flavonoid glycosyltransferase YjiC (YdhE family)
MNVIIMIVGTRGDVQPFFGLGESLSLFFSQKLNFISTAAAARKHQIAGAAETATHAALRL